MKALHGQLNVFFPNRANLGSSDVFSHRKGLEQVGAAEIPKVPRFPGTGSPRFPSKVPEQGSRARFLSKVHKPRSPKVPKNRFPGKVPRNRFLKVPKQGFQGAQARSQSKAPKQGPQSKVARNRRPLILKGSQEQVPRQGSQEQVPQGSQQTSSEARLPRKVPKQGCQGGPCQGSVKALSSPGYSNDDWRQGKLKSFHFAFLNGGAGGTTLNTREGGSESNDSTRRCITSRTTSVFFMGGKRNIRKWVQVVKPNSCNVNYIN